MQKILPDESIMVKCDCGAEALEVQFWPSDDRKDQYPDEFYFAFWQQGFSRPLCWRERLRWCWNILRKGNPWGDSILVYQPKAKQVADFIYKHLKSNGQNEDGGNSPTAK